LATLFAQHNIKAAVKSRQKKAWSVFRKMEMRGLSFEQLSDIFGFRVLVDDRRDCYQVLGVIHTTWPVVPGRFKDYISIPKQNGYRSLHTTIVGPSRQRVELQIRTHAMNEIAEYGVAAHSIYKDHGSGSDVKSKVDETAAYAWLRQTIQALAEGDNPEEFLEHTKLELFQDQVFCFTPRGRLIALPRGATPIDFAYGVHTDIGDSCVGAKINGRVMPLMTRLKNGDEVDIIRSKAQVPPAAWEEMVVTGKARAAIRRATRAAVRKQYSGLGLRILERSFERLDKKFEAEDLEGILHKLGRKYVDDVLAAVGRGELPSQDVVRALYPDEQEGRGLSGAKASGEGWFNIQNAPPMVFKVPQTGEEEKKRHAVPIRGIHGDVAVRFAPEGAVPGDRIVGIMQPGAGIIIYPIQSPALTAYDDQPERWIDVRWDLEAGREERFPARIRVLAINAPGSLAEISQLIAASDANIQNLSMVRTAPDFTEMMIDMEVWDLKHLTKIIAQLKRADGVSEAWRVNG